VLFQKSYLVYRVALLLALVMVLSLLPMNVFGAPGRVIPPLADRHTTADPRDNDDVGAVGQTVNNTVHVLIPASAFSGMAGMDVLNTLEFVMTGRGSGGGAATFTGAAGTSDGTENTLVRWAAGAVTGDVSEVYDTLVDNTAQSRGIFLGGSEATMVQRTAANITIQITSGGAVIPVGTGDVLFELEDVFLGTQNGVQLSAYLTIAGGERVQILAPSNLVRGVLVEGVEITAGSPVVLATGVVLPDITIQELAGGIGRLFGTTDAPLVNNAIVQAVRLTAPSGFRFIRPSASLELLDVNDVVATVDWANTDYSDSTFLTTDASGRHVLTIHFTGDRGATPFAQGTRAGFRIRGIGLLADHGNLADGDVRVDVALGFARAGGLNAYFQDRESINAGAGTLDRRNAANRASVVVARRNLIGDFEVTEPYSPFTIFSGTIQGELTAGADYEDRYLRISETVQRTLLTGYRAIEFRLREPGVMFNQAGTVWRTFTGDPPGPSDDWNNVRAGGGPLLLPGWGAPNNVRSFVIRPENSTDAGIRSLDVRFGLAVPAGFEANEGGEIHVGVYIGGEFMGDFLIADVVDRISIPQVSVTPFVANPAGVLAPTMINNVVIEETAPGRIRTGQSIRIGVVATLQGTPLDLQLPVNLSIGNVSVNSADSGMVLGGLTRETVERTIVIPNPQFVAGVTDSNHVNYDPANTGTDDPRYPATLEATTGEMEETGYFLLPVTTSSSDVEAIITLSNIMISGGLGASFPGVEFNLVVAGHAVVDFDTVANRNFIGRLPYSTVVLSTDLGVVVGPDGLPSTGINVMPLELRPGMGSIWTNVGGAPQVVEAPFRFIPNQVDGNLMGMLNPRVFADWINGDVSYAFVDGALQVTITGRHFDGHIVEVFMIGGQNTALINGETHDIATFAARDGHGTGPAGSVAATIDGGRAFVPIRFLTNAFGRFVTFGGEFPDNVVVTLEG